MASACQTHGSPNQEAVADKVQLPVLQSFRASLLFRWEEDEATEAWSRADIMPVK